MNFYKRRQYLVNKAMQWAAVGWVMLIVLAILGFHTWFTFHRLDGAVQVDPRKLSLQSLLLQDFFITMAVMTVFIVFMAIFGSHKVAGPLYRCEKAIKLAQEGDLTDVIRLRRGDLLVPFSEEVNLALANLREFAADDRAHVQEAVRLILLARGAIGIPEVQTSLERAIATLSRVGSKLKIESDAARARGNAILPLEVDPHAQYLGGPGANRTMALVPPPVARPAGATPPPAAPFGGRSAGA